MSTPTEVAVSPAEVAAERLTPEKLDRALAAMRVHGFVVLDNAIHAAHLDALRSKMTRDSELLLRGATLAPKLFWSANGARPGHLQQSIPRTLPHVFRDVVCNPFANQVSRALLGEGAFFSFPLYNCNVNCPGSVDQDVHFDPAPPGTLVVNIGLRDVAAEDGAIELWPGSHTDLVETNPIPDDVRERRRARVPPIRGQTKKGSLLIRDLRLWHRGRANPSQELRHMIGILHYPAAAIDHPFCWAKAPTHFSSACAPLFAGSPVRPNVVFTDLPIPYLVNGPASEIASLVTGNRVVRKVLRGARRVAGLWSRSAPRGQ